MIPIPYRLVASLKARPPSAAGRVRRSPLPLRSSGSTACSSPPRADHWHTYVLFILPQGAEVHGELQQNLRDWTSRRVPSYSVAKLPQEVISRDLGANPTSSSYTPRVPTWSRDLITWIWARAGTSNGLGKAQRRTATEGARQFRYHLYGTGYRIHRVGSSGLSCR